MTMTVINEATVSYDANTCFCTNAYEMLLHIIFFCRKQMKLTKTITNSLQLGPANEI